MTNYTISFAVSGQRISATVPTVPVSDTRRYLRAQFTFDASWDDLKRLGVFIGLRSGMNTAAGRGAHEVHTVELDDDDSCLFPAEVLTSDHGILQVGVVGYSADGEARLTTDTCTMRQQKSCFYQGQSPNPPAPDLYADMMRAAADARAAADRAEALADEVAQNAADGLYNGQDGAPGERGPSGMIPLHTLSPLESRHLLPANHMSCLTAVSPAIFSLGEGEDGFDNEWGLTVTLCEYASASFVDTVHWPLGIAPPFEANTTTVCRLYKVGNTLCGEWVTL